MIDRSPHLSLLRLRPGVRHKYSAGFIFDIPTRHTAAGRESFVCGVFGQYARVTKNNNGTNSVVRRNR